MSKARLAQSVEHETLNLGVVGSSPTLGEIFLHPNIDISKLYFLVKNIMNSDLNCLIYIHIVKYLPGQQGIGYYI